MSATTFILSPAAVNSCRYHIATPDLRCLGCRMAMGAPADSYLDGRGQRRYYSNDLPPPPPPPSLSPAPSAGESDEESYLLRMRFALQEMDKGIDFVKGERFLDLGCCPGGFSTYVLSKLPTIHGEGVSLPVEQGGHSLAIPVELRSRFQIHWGDMTRFNHAPEHAGSGRLSGRPNFPVPPNSFDLVLADGHIPPELMMVKEAQRFARDLLLVSQLLAAVRAVKLGGTILVKLSLSLANKTFDGLMHRIVLGLDKLSDTPLVALKPKSIYGSRGSFYVLVRDVEAVPRRMVELSLESAWVQLAEGQNINPKALDRLASASETRRKQEWLMGFLEPVEEVRRTAKLGMV
ncbi:hypothetical protein FRC10_005498 [Ceratobasidium sp. 414]|nr:hypothetical protein FRC10_005498 [Ceratobasidium sp. 414]